MKTKFTSIALTLAGVTIFGLGLVNNGNAYAANTKDKLSIERVRIIEENPSNAQNSNGECCDPNPLGVATNGVFNLGNKEVLSNDHNGAQSHGNDVQSNGNEGVPSDGNQVRSSNNEGVRLGSQIDLIENFLGDDYSRGGNLHNDQNKVGLNNQRD